MLPKFDVRQGYAGGRWFVETDWFIVDGRNMHTCLQVTTSGRLGAASAGWATEAKARAAMEQCKARLR